jgi:hypothetical protein
MSASTRALSFIAAIDFWRRAGAMMRKEFLQLRRDRITFATMITIPLIQLILFGYAINTTPRDLPTAVLLQESSDGFLFPFLGMHLGAESRRVFAAYSFPAHRSRHHVEGLDARSITI